MWFEFTPKGEIIEHGRALLPTTEQQHRELGRLTVLADQIVYVEPMPELSNEVNPSNSNAS